MNYSRLPRLLAALMLIGSAGCVGQPPAGSDFRYAFVAVAKKAMPAVVSIEVPPAVTLGLFSDGGPFEFFFGTPRDERLRVKRTYEQTAMWLGSGFMVAPHGYIVTSYQLVRDVDRLGVRFPDGYAMHAALIGADTANDIAVLALEGEPPPGVTPLRLRDSNSLEAGEWVIALGAPPGADATLAAGIISAKDLAPAIAVSDNFLQTSASINPANSGGPLVDIDGEVVGINSAGLAPSCGRYGLGCAIPINLAKTLLDGFTVVQR